MHTNRVSINLIYQLFLGCHSITVFTYNYETHSNYKASVTAKGGNYSLKGDTK